MEKNLPNINLYYERYMKSFEIVDDFKGLGPGTLFHGDSGYLNHYEDLIERLKEDFEKYEVENVDSIQFINTGKKLTTFILGYSVFWD